MAKRPMVPTPNLLKMMGQPGTATEQNHLLPQQVLLGADP